MKASDIREAYLRFFEKRGHLRIPSSSLVPENDPTTLFTGSGMQPLLPYLMGQEHPMGRRLTNSQKSFRAEDIDEVGDNRHTTFFEMLGNWSLGEYFKEEQLLWFFEFLTRELHLEADRLWVTCFEGDEALNLPRDEESARIWEKLGIPEERILFYGAEKNWWSRAGVPENMPAGEPGGPDSEVFFDFRTEHDPAFGKACHPNCDCGRFLEIGNSVFMEYKKEKDGSFSKLSQKNVDFGGGLERLTAAVNDNPDIFAVDLLSGIIGALEKLSGKTYGEHSEPFRVIADHVRAASFMIADGVLPSNTDRGYFVRRLLRRAVLRADELEAAPGTLASLAAPAAEAYGKEYSELAEQREVIEKTVEEEEAKFRSTLMRGLKRLRELFGNKEKLTGQELFSLFSTDGFPLELSLEQLGRMRGRELSQKEKERLAGEFDEERVRHQRLSRTASAGRFKGGLADASEETTRLHTAHHLLLAALRQVLGGHVHQRGSNITAERLRLDFSHPAKLTAGQLREVEDLVNEKIAEGLDMLRLEMSREEAVRMGAEMEFGVKYGETVSVYAARSGRGEDFSREFCGGPHAANTSELGRFKILKEEAVSSGIRRIRGVLT